MENGWLRQYEERENIFLDSFNIVTVCFRLDLLFATILFIRLFMSIFSIYVTLHNEKIRCDFLSKCWMINEIEKR